MGNEPASAGRSTVRAGPLNLGRRVLVPLTVAVVILGMVGTIRSFQSRYDAARTVQESLIAAQLSLYAADATVLDYIPATADVQLVGRAAADASLARATSSFVALGRSDAGPELAAVRREFQTYVQGAALAITQRSTGPGGEALTLYLAEADPPLDALQADLTGDVAHFGAEADHAEHLRQVGSIAVLLLGGLILGALMLRSQGQRRRLLAGRSRESGLRDNERRFLSLMDGSADPVTILDRDGHVTFQSASIERLLGWSASEMLGKDFAEYLDPQGAAGLLELIARAERRPLERRTVEWRLRTSRGAMIDVEAVLAGRFDDPDIGGVLINVRDIGERIALEEALRHRAFHDSLTGLANRTLFEDRLANALDRTARSGETACVLLADLDDFKDVNDSFGHAIGDQLLLKVSERLSSCVRPHDTLARVGGDAFAILVEVSDEHEGAAVGERVVTALVDPISLDGIEVFAHASIGIATGSGAGKGKAAPGTAAQMLVEADLALHEAKQHARGRVRFYTPSLQDGVMERMALRSDLERGLSRGEFTLHYQPIVKLASGRLVGAEALVRWRHPERGLVSPAEFIPTAERTGMIRELGHWVMVQACQEAASWPAPLDGSLGPSVSVNVAGPQLRQPDFVAEVTATLADAGLDPHRLVIEVTESILIEHDNETKLSELQRMGVILAIDDFGTGYSSLSYLRRFNMDVLKIDKSFIDHVGTDAKGAALVAAMIGIGTSLGMDVVAEGIESPEQLEALRDLQCLFGQGYLFSRPVEPVVLRALLERGGPLMALTTVGPPMREAPRSLP